MRDLKSHFVFNKTERNGIFLLVFIIIILQGVYFYVDFSSEVNLPPKNQEEIVRFQAQIDSLKKVASAEDTLEIYPFNPNFISDFKGYMLGMSVEEINKLHSFRASEKWINSEEDFQKVTGVSDSLLSKISPYFRFPTWSTNSEARVAGDYEMLETGDEYNGNLTLGQISGSARVSGSSGHVIRDDSIPIQDLNEATAEALKLVNGVGEVLSKRIVKYRESIGGFRAEVQLHDVYGLSPEVVERITKSFKILKKPEVELKDINSVSVLELSEVPGFTYELAREVVEYRNLKKRIHSFEELGKIKGFPLEKINRIQLYLAIK